MTVYGYVRKNYPNDTFSQIELIRTYKIDELIIENTNFTFDNELQAVLKKLDSNDTFIVISMTSFGKSISELEKIMGMFNSKNIKFVSIKEKIDTTETYPFHQMLRIIDMIHKEVFSKKVKQQLVEIKKSGKQLGRPKVSPEIVATMTYLREEKKMSFRQISDYCGVSLGTVYKYAKD